MTSRRTETLVWTGVLAAPLAASVQHLVTYLVSEANCDPVGSQWDVAFSTWVAASTVVTALAALGGLAAALVVFRGLREVEVDDDPPPGRIWLMSTCGLAICPLLLAVILLDGIGALALGSCHQG